MLTLPDKPTLKDFQQYVQEMVLERGFQEETPVEVLMLLIEEVGELAKAIRKTTGVKIANNAAERNVSDEVADVFSLLLDLCNLYKIDLEQAYRAMEAKNQERTWS